MSQNPEAERERGRHLWSVLKRFSASEQVQAAGAVGELSPSSPPSTNAETMPPGSVRPRRLKAYRTPTRDVLKTGTFWNCPAAWRQLKLLSAQSGISQQALVGDALNLLFRRHGLPPVANGAKGPAALTAAPASLGAT